MMRDLESNDCAGAAHFANDGSMTERRGEADSAIGEVQWTLWLEQKIETAARKMLEGDSRSRAWWNGYHDGMRLVLAKHEGTTPLFILGSAICYDRPEQGVEAINYLAGLNDGFNRAMPGNEREDELMMEGF